MKTPLSAAIAIGFGLVVLLGYFIDLPILDTLRQVFVQWAVILVSVAMLVGVANLALAHWRKIGQEQAGGAYSILVLVSLVVTLLVVGYFGPTGDWSLWIFNNIQVPVESSLMAILAVVLVYASARVLRQRINLLSVVFIGTVLVMLILAVPWLGIEIPGLHGPDGLRSFISQVLAIAGARGILIGVALGTIATGLRVLMGADRPYGG
jgi:hypothetical protein